MSKQTAVEWLFNKMITEKHTISEWNDIREQAKEMEKEQIMDAHIEGMDSLPVYPNYNKDAEEYYNENYKIKK